MNRGGERVDFCEISGEGLRAQERALAGGFLSNLG